MYWPPLDKLEEHHVNYARTLVEQLVHEKYPELATDGGVVSDLLLDAHAIMQGAGLQSIETLRRSLTVHDIALAPEEAFEGAVDAVVSNYRVYREISMRARCSVTLVLSRCSGINIGPDIGFRAHGATFRVLRSVSIRPPGFVCGRYDCAAQKCPDGTYTVTLDMEAEKGGAGLRRFDVMTVSPKPVGLIKAYAACDASGFQRPQTNRELIDKCRSGIAQQGFSNSDAVEALIRDAYSDIVDVVVVGARHPRMARDVCDGKSVGGAIDVYVRSQAYPALRSRSVDATLVTRTEDMLTWTVDLDRHTFPGFYDIVDVRTLGATSADCEVTAVEFGYDDSAPDLPHGLSPAEARYSPFQTARLTFTQTQDGPIHDPNSRFEVTARMMPWLESIQNHLTSPEICQPGVDVLVKAVRPCFISPKIVSAQSVTAAVVAAIADHVNAQYTGYVPTSGALMRAATYPDEIVSITITGVDDVDDTTAVFMDYTKD
jgi:hypothetical protein